MRTIINKIRRFLAHPSSSIKARLYKVYVLLVRIFYKIYYNKNIILLESHCVFDGNSGAIFKYMRTQKKYRKYVYVWIIQNFPEGSYKNSRHVLVFSTENSSYKKKWLMCHAKIAFYDNVSVRACGNGAKTIYLTHGCPQLKNVKGIINVPQFVDYALCTSSNIVDLFSEQVSFPKEKFFISGQPRNDILFEPRVDVSSLFDEKKYNKIILWLPTFRKASNSERNDSTKEFPLGIPLFESFDQFDFVNSELKKLNCLLIIKVHPLQEISIIKVSDTDNILFLSHAQLLDKGINTYSLLPHTDALISDYSSVVFDYMLLEKPMAYLFDDIDQYKLGLMKNYEKFTPGLKMRTIDEFVGFIRSVCEGVDEFYDERHAITEYLHQYRDGDNCKRILKQFYV